MPEVKIRKVLVSVEETFHEGGPVASEPLLKASCLAVIENPYAGRFESDIQGFMDDLKPLGIEMAEKLIEALGGDACLLYTSPSPRDATLSRMPSSA